MNNTQLNNEYIKAMRAKDIQRTNVLIKEIFHRVSKQLQQTAHDDNTLALATAIENIYTIELEVHDV